MSYIDELLELLATTEGPHTLDEISRSIGISRHTCQKIVHFLAKFGFLYINDFKVQIKPKVRNFVIATSDKTFIELNPPIPTF